MKVAKHISDGLSGRNRRVGRESRAGPAKRSLCDQSVNPGRRAVIEIIRRFLRLLMLVEASSCGSSLVKGVPELEANPV